MLAPTMADANENFDGNDKHYKVLRQALHEDDITVWNEFAASMGPRFRADLRGIQLNGADLRGAKLTGARLENACLDNADLTDADLTGASLTGASFRNATLSRPPRLSSKARVTIRSDRPVAVESLPPEVRRQRRIDQMQQTAKDFLEEKAQKEAALERQKAQVKARNNPSPFQNEDKRGRS